MSAIATNAVRGQTSLIFLSETHDWISGSGML